jgi:hypothetical protein
MRGVLSPDVEGVIEVEFGSTVFVVSDKQDRLADDCHDCVLVLLRQALQETWRNARERDPPRTPALTWSRTLGRSAASLRVISAFSPGTPWARINRGAPFADAGVS